MSFASPYPAVRIPTTSVYDYLFSDLGDTDAERVALVDTRSGDQMTCGEMLARIDTFAGALADRGVGVGTSSGWPTTA